jgi:hypothetical protein
LVRYKKIESPMSFFALFTSVATSNNNKEDDTDEIFPMRLTTTDASGGASEDTSVPQLSEWRAMLSDGRADAFVRQIVEHTLGSVLSERPVDVVVDDVHHHDGDDNALLVRICGEANAALLRANGIAGLSELRGTPTAVLQDLIPGVDDVDLWPQMAAALADGKSWFDVERLKASRSLRVRTPPARLRAVASSPKTPQSSKKRALPASEAKATSSANNSSSAGKRSRAAAPSSSSAKKPARSSSRRAK